MSRRSVLRNSAAAAGALTVGATGTAAGFIPATGSDAGTSNKRGGRAQADGDLRRNEPFTLSDTPSSVSRNASCMAEESAEQTYLEYDIQYCDSDDEESDATLYVIPDEAPLAQDETYVIRSIRGCRDSDLQRVAFGPAPHGC